ncbi:MAG: hypothetical protein QOJ44_1133, partial [Acidimicrobiaceae bacterium]|nr:hypothetical protein [Acidimicrobiaceae bacterium]
AYAGGRHQRRIDEISAYEATQAAKQANSRPTDQPVAP